MVLCVSYCIISSNNIASGKKNNIANCNYPQVSIKTRIWWIFIVLKKIKDEKLIISVDHSDNPHRQSGPYAR